MNPETAQVGMSPQQEDIQVVSDSQGLVNQVASRKTENRSVLQDSGSLGSTAYQNQSHVKKEAM